MDLRRLHREADARHPVRQLVGTRHGIEVHAPAEADVARASQHDDRLRHLGREGLVGPPQEPAAPRRARVRLGRGARPAVERPLVHELAVALAPHPRRLTAQGRRRDLDVVLTGRADGSSPRRVRDAQSGQVEHVRAVYLRDGVIADREAPG
ncbi:MAG: hypothetical protein WEC34_12020 [Acidimicrobiia bacterium]